MSPVQRVHGVIGVTRQAGELALRAAVWAHGEDAAVRIALAHAGIEGWKTIRPFRPGYDACTGAASAAPRIPMLAQQPAMARFTGERLTN